MAKPTSNEIHNNVPCPGGSCGFGTGAGIVVSTIDVNGIDFALVQGGRITGKVTNASTLADVPNASVSVFNSVGNYVSFANTAADGTYRTGGLPGGTYYARSTATGLIAQAYNGVICSNCSVTSGTPIPLSSTANVTGINFSLAPGASISGALTDPSSSPIINMNVQVLTSTGAFVASNSSVGPGRLHNQRTRAGHLLREGDGQYHVHPSRLSEP